MLHGKIEINDVAIGKWEAERIETIFARTHRYDCRVWYRNHEGHPLHAEFQVVNYEGNGAIGLAALVISTGMKKLKGYPRGTDKEFPV